MRLISRTIYRAFPELDRYSDEQCIRFVKSARGSWLRQAFGGLLIVVAAIVTLIPCAILLLRIVDFQHGRFDPMRPPFRLGTLVGLAASVALITPGPLVGILLRDWLLRRRVRFVLRSRGVCRSCRYSLVGLAVGADHRVRCPECGAEMEVDPSLGELATDDAGRVRFKPELDGAVGPAFWTERRVRAARRAVFWSVSAVLVLAAAVVGGQVIHLRLQADRARSARDGNAKGLRELTALIEESQPAGTSPNSPNAWDEYLRATATLVTLPALDRRIRATKRGSHVWPVFELLYLSPAETLSRDPEYVPACKALAQELLVAMTDAGASAALREMAARPRAACDLDVLPGVPLWEFSPLRQHSWVLHEYCAARAALARLGGDQATHLDALESLLALARVYRQQPFPATYARANRAELLGHRELIALLLAEPSAEWIAGAKAAIDRQRSNVPPDHQLRGRRIVAEDTISWFFSDPARLRPGARSDIVERFNHELPGPHRLGTYRENISELERVIKPLRARAAMDAWQLQQAAVPRTGLTLVDGLMSLGWMWYGEESTARLVELRRRGVSIMFALDACKRDRGDYPQSLDELVPRYITALPPDPWTGKALRYRRIDPAADKHHRCYLLYSIGTDGIDDVGTSHDELINQPTETTSGF